MQIEHLHLKNFRNFSSLDIDFHPLWNFFIGDNGQGKTNLLEAMYILSMVKGFRGSSDADLVKLNEGHYFVKSQSKKDDDRDIKLAIGYSPQKKVMKIFDEQVDKVSDFIGQVKVVYFCNEDMEYIKGSPSARRRFLDIALSMAIPGYLPSLQRYNKCLQNRNLALKSGTDHFFAWDDQLVKYGSDIIMARMAFFEGIKPIAPIMYLSINSDIKNFSCEYKNELINTSGVSSIEELHERYYTAFKNKKQRELDYKQTLIGPHRDDFLIKNGKQEFKSFGSQGQCRVAALCLKILMTNYIERPTGQKAILLLDDPLLDLDEKKKVKFWKQVEDRQIFYTATNTQGLQEISAEGFTFRIAENMAKKIST